MLHDEVHDSGIVLDEVPVLILLGMAVVPLVDQNFEHVALLEDISQSADAVNLVATTVTFALLESTVELGREGKR